MTAAVTQIEVSPSSSSADAELVLIPKDGIERVAPMMMQFIRGLVPVLGHTVDAADIIDMAARGEIQLWIVWNPSSNTEHGMVVTELLTFPQKRIARALGVTGEGMLGMDVSRMIETLSDWATSEGCDRIELYGRAGWARFLSSHWVDAGHVWKKDL